MSLIDAFATVGLLLIFVCLLTLTALGIVMIAHEIDEWRWDRGARKWRNEMMGRDE